MKLLQLPLPFASVTVEIPLTQGQSTIIDAVDADLAAFKWCAMKSTHGGFYAVRNIGPRKNRRLLFLHRVILERVLGYELTSADEVDHANTLKLDNRRGNLRLATTAQNQHNSKIRIDNTSGYKGVTRIENGKGERWIAGIQVNGKRVHLGTFDSPELAHDAYRTAAEQLRGEFARAA